MLSFERLKSAVASGEIDTVVVAFADRAGQLVGKRLHAEHFVESAHEETHACGDLLANEVGRQAGDGDFVLRPDLSTLRRTPWLPGAALAIADVLDDQGHDIAHNPRAILKAQMARLAALGLKPFFASELEFYLFDESDEAL